MLALFAQQVLAEPGFEFKVRGGDGMVGCPPQKKLFVHSILLRKPTISYSFVLFINI